MSYGYGPPPAGSPARCAACGGVATNPHDTQCRFCGAMLGASAQQAAHPPYPPYPPYPSYAHAPPQQAPYGQQAPSPYPQQQPYPQQGYGPPPGYGAPPYQQMPYQGYPPVQGFGGGYGRQINRNWFGSGMSTFFWIRIAAIGFFIVISGVGACVSAISNH